MPEVLVARCARLDREFRELIAVLSEFRMTEGLELVRVQLLELTDLVTSAEGWGPAAPPDPPALR